jgi:hypothetical protein
MRSDGAIHTAAGELSGAYDLTTLDCFDVLAMTLSVITPQLSPLWPRAPHQSNRAHTPTSASPAR